MWFGSNQKKNTNKGDHDLEWYKKRARNVVKRYKKSVLQYDTYSGRIMIGGSYHKAFDELAREMGGDGDAFEYLAGCFFGIAVGQDSKKNSRLVQDNYGW